MRLLIAILLVLLLYLQYRLWLGDGSLTQMWRLEQELTQHKQENARLRERNAALEAEVKDLKQGLEAIEERARSEMGMIKKGETYYQVIEDDAASTSK
jgi:cell division protein FtsB